jgi:hypothetical protein
MTDTEARRALRALNREGLVWDEIAHQINLLAGGRRVITMDTIRRFVVEERKMRSASTYWVERWLEARTAPSSEVA